MKRQPAPIPTAAAGAPPLQPRGAAPPPAADAPPAVPPVAGRGALPVGPAGEPSPELYGNVGDPAATPALPSRDGRGALPAPAQGLPGASDELYGNLGGGQEGVAVAGAPPLPSAAGRPALQRDEALPAAAASEQIYGNVETEGPAAPNASAPKLMPRQPSLRAAAALPPSAADVDVYANSQQVLELLGLKRGSSDSVRPVSDMMYESVGDMAGSDVYESVADALGGAPSAGVSPEQIAAIPESERLALMLQVKEGKLAVQDMQTKLFSLAREAPAPV